MAEELDPFKELDNELSQETKDSDPFKEMEDDKLDEAQIDNIAERFIKFGLPYLPPKSDLKKWAKFVNENKYEIGKQVLTGTTLQFGDEIVAGVRSFVENEPYEKSLKDVRTEMKTFEKEQPGVSTAAQIGGSMLPFLATRGKTPIATLPGAMATGTTIAGVAGFGAGEGGFVPRLKKAATYAPFGTLAPLATGLLGVAAKPITNLFRKKPTTSKELFEKGDEFYKARRNIPLNVKKPTRKRADGVKEKDIVFKNKLDEIEKILKIDPLTAPKSKAILGDLKNAAKGKDAIDNERLNPVLDSIKKLKKEPGVEGKTAQNLEIQLVKAVDDLNPESGFKKASQVADKAWKKANSVEEVEKIIDRTKGNPKKFAAELQKLLKNESWRFEDLSPAQMRNVKQLANPNFVTRIFSKKPVTDIKRMARTMMNVAGTGAQYGVYGMGAGPLAAIAMGLARQSTLPVRAGVLQGAQKKQQQLLYDVLGEKMPIPGVFNTLSKTVLPLESGKLLGEETSKLIGDN
tara:strand:+ start:1100 stop:2650 length:1551 start_codon:yes stop_codon:yes gene_type:complete